MLTAEALEATVWLCFKGSGVSGEVILPYPSWGGQWFPQESHRVWLRWGLAGRCSCTDSQRRERLILLRKEEMKNKFEQVTLGCFVFSLLCSPGALCCSRLKRLKTQRLIHG